MYVTVPQTTTRNRSTLPSLTSNFDPSVAQLAPNFVGHDGKALFYELSNRGSGTKKGEFETTEEYRARVQRESSAPVLGRLNSEGLFAFTLTNSSGETLYDADNQTMTVAVALSKPSSNSDISSEKRSLTTQFDNNEETYEGSNAYGAKVQVKRELGKDYALAFGNYSQFGMERYIDSMTRQLGYTSDIHAIDAIMFHISMNVPTAKRIKSNLKTLAVVRLIQPYTFQDTFYKKPTFNEPREYFVQYYYLNTELRELWVYDSTTGEILAKKKV